MQRSEFLVAASGFMTAKMLVPADQSDKADESVTSNREALRVLLGKGDAQRIDDRSFSYDGRAYRGSFTMLDDGHVVNTVALEEYLYSVVPREMPPSWPQPALQAQAIIARTFVLRRSAPSRDWDLVPSQADQVYTGLDAEHREASAAVDATAGQVLRYDNGFALAMYSSCCGGHTESSSAAWNGAPVPYLGGVACTHCSDSPWYSWTQTFDAERMENASGPLLPGGFDPMRVELRETDASGRSRFWAFSDDTMTIDVPAAKIREALGTRALPSLRVRKIALSSQAPRKISIEGAGLGHGVGLCQWGAGGLAREGAGTGDILRYYYPGTGIGND